MMSLVMFRCNHTNLSLALGIRVCRINVGSAMWCQFVSWFSYPPRLGHAAQEAASELQRVGALPKESKSCVADGRLDRLESYGKFIDVDRVLVPRWQTLTFNFSRVWIAASGETCLSKKTVFSASSRILRSAHSEGVTAVGFVPEGVECNLLITRDLAQILRFMKAQHESGTEEGKSFVF